MSLKNATDAELIEEIERRRTAAVMAALEAASDEELRHEIASRNA